MLDLEGLPTIHYTKVPQPDPDSPIHQEVLTFFRELPRLLAVGHEGQWALIKGDAIVGLFATLEEGYRTGYEKFLQRPFIVQPVREWQPLLSSAREFRYATINKPSEQ